MHTAPIGRKPRRLLVVLGLILLVLISYGCIYFYYHVRIRLDVIGAVENLGDIRQAFFKFHATHRRWPRTMEEIYGEKTSEGVITEKCKDFISDSPFRCVTEKELFYKIGKERPYRVFVTLPQPYRTELWPFGEMKTIIATESGVHSVSLSEIIDMN